MSKTKKIVLTNETIQGAALPSNESGLAYMFYKRLGPGILGIRNIMGNELEGPYYATETQWENMSIYTGLGKSGALIGLAHNGDKWIVSSVSENTFQFNRPNERR